MKLLGCEKSTPVKAIILDLPVSTFMILEHKLNWISKTIKNCMINVT
jgi:hypothetical protein